MAEQHVPGRRARLVGTAIAAPGVVTMMIGALAGINVPTVIVGVLVASVGIVTMITGVAISEDATNSERPH